MTQLTLIAADGKKTEIVDLPCVIGRTKANGLVLESDRVSRQHAKFDRDGNGLIVVDLGSANGTYVNGVRITEGSPLRSGDKLQFANLTFTVEVPSDLSRTIVGGFSVLETPVVSQDPQPHFNKIPLVHEAPAVPNSVPGPQMAAPSQPLPVPKPAHLPQPAPLPKLASLPQPELIRLPVSPPQQSSPPQPASPQQFGPLPQPASPQKLASSPKPASPPKPASLPQPASLPRPASLPQPASLPKPASLPQQADPWSVLEAKYQTLLNQQRQGQLTQQVFTENVNGLRHCDVNGLWWQISPTPGNGFSTTAPPGKMATRLDFHKVRSREQVQPARISLHRLPRPGQYLMKQHPFPRHPEVASFPHIWYR